MRTANEHAIESILSHAVEEVFVKESLEAKLRSGKKLRVKLGIDPTSPHIHIGRAVVLWKLRAFQDLGHMVVFIVGDFTALIGDPSDKLSKRPMLTPAEVKTYLKRYREQVGKIIDLKKAEFHFNSKWLKKLDFGDVAALADAFSVQQMSHRRNFADRIENGEEISLREFLYPLMQGYDSVAVKADVEIGGFDQLFNLKAGRIIQKQYGQPEQDIMTCVMLEGTDGRKMSSSWGNIIAIDDEPLDMYGKTMSLRDDLVGKYLELTTSLDAPERARVMDELFVKNPRDAKMRLAYELVKRYHGEAKAKAAEAAFIGTFQKKETPDSVIEVRAESGAPLVDAFLDAGVVASKSEFNRLRDGGAIEMVGEGAQKITEAKPLVGDVPRTFKVGKRRFVRVVPR